MRTGGRTSTQSRSRRLAVACTAVVCISAALCGCGWRSAMYEEIGSARRVAYERWAAGEGADEVRISGELSLTDAVKLALLHNKPLRAALEQREIGRGRVVGAYSEALPSVQGTASYTHLDEVATFSFQGREISTGELDNYSAGLEIRQPLYRGGAIGAAIRAAQLFYLRTDEEVRGQVQRTIYEVARNYFDVLLARRLEAVNREAVVSARTQLEDVRAKLRRGAAYPYDVLRAEVELSNFRAEEIQQRNRANLAKTRLLKTMGVSQRAEVTLSDELGYEPVKPVLEEAVRIAHTNRPDLYLAELDVRLQREALRIARSRYWPDVDAIFTNTWARPDPHTTLPNWGHEWVASVEMRWPIFDGLEREGRIIEERARLRQQRIALADAEERTLLEIRQAMLSLRDAEEFVESQRMNLERAEEGLRLAEVGYREGVNTEVEVVDARAALTRARGLYYEAVYGHTLARLDLQRAMGILGPGAGERGATDDVEVRPAHVTQFGEDAEVRPGPATRPARPEETQSP